MNWKQLATRIRNLDHNYLQWDRFSTEAYKETDPESKRGLQRISEKFRRKYEALVNDRRRVT